jgi:nucleotide-binding universal stress UspA family protein
VNYQNILAAVDFSESSNTALQRAASIARASGAEFHVAHAIETLTYRGVTYQELLSPDSQIKERAQAQKTLTEAVDGLGKDPVPASVELLDGDPRNVIVKHAEKIGADLIVLGSHGHGRLHDVLLGSITGHISHIATCSVLIVKS